VTERPELYAVTEILPKAFIVVEDIKGNILGVVPLEAPEPLKGEN